MTVEQSSQSIWEELENEDRAAAGLAPLEPAAKPIDDKTTADPKASIPGDAADPAASAPVKSPLEKQLEELTHLVKSTVGRVGSLQSELQKVAGIAATRVADAPTQKQIDAAGADPAKWTRMKEDFPDWADAIDSYVTNKLSAVQKPTGISQDEVDRRVTERVMAARAEDSEDLLGFFRPKWKDDLSSDGFANWFKNQPAEYQTERGSSVKASVVMTTLKEYDSHVEAAKATAAAAAQHNASSKKRLAASAMPSGVTPPPTKSEEDMSPQEYWAHLEAIDQRKRAQGG